MTDFPAREAYRRWSKDTAEWAPTQGRVLADAALDEQPAIVKAQKFAIDDLVKQLEQAEQGLVLFRDLEYRNRAALEQAEAEVARWKTEYKLELAAHRKTGKQLEERVEEWAAVAIDCAEWAENEHEESIRRIALETRAERERDEAVHCESYMKDILHNMLKTHALLVNDLYRQIEYLKCCGNCNNFEIEHDSYGECDQSCSAMKSPTDTTEEKYFKHDWPMMDGRFGYCQPQDKCHWKVSRWKEWPF